MVFEQKKLLIRKVVWLVVLIINIILAVCFIGRTATLVSDECFVEYSTSSYGGKVYGSDCELVLSYDKNVEEGEVEVAFFDPSGEEICIKESSWGTTDGKQITYTFYISGNVDAYEIISEGAMIATVGVLNIVPAIIAISLIAFIISLFYKCKVFKYEDKEVIIYAGLVGYYIKIDGELYDKKKSLYSFNRTLSCTVNENLWIDVNIGAFNNISVKINDKFYNS